MAIYTLRQILTERPVITIGDLTLTNFVKQDVTISPSQVIIETIEGDDPGLIIRTNSPLSTSSAAQSIGFEFRVTSTEAIIEGASASLSGISFGSTNAGGSVELDITQGGPNDNISISAFVDNNPSVPDVNSDSDTIVGGPVNTFRFEYDLDLLPAPGVTTTFTSSTILFDLVDDVPTLPPDFNGLQYIASYGDLITAFGANATAGEQHYLSNGFSEGRSADRFDEAQYLENYGDLQLAFGSNGAAATQHFITNGFSEGRTDIDGRQYIASYGDLIEAFGDNPATGLQHYVSNGISEGRVGDDFNEVQYLANYADLQAAFGSNGDLATQHFITNGYFECRTDVLI